MPKLIDISIGISDQTPTYPNDPPFKFGWDHRIGNGRRSNLSFISMGSHTGTHIDAPLHFLDNGETIDQLPLESLVGPCQVVETKNPKAVEPKELPSLRGIERVLFKTRNSRAGLLHKKEFSKDFVALSLETAKILVKNKIKLVGIDYLSIEPFGHKQPEVHWALLKAGIVIVEGMDLSKVSAGKYHLTCLPLKVVGAEGAPCRAILQKNE